MFTHRISTRKLKLFYIYIHNGQMNSNINERRRRMSYFHFLVLGQNKTWHYVPPFNTQWLQYWGTECLYTGLTLSVLKLYLWLYLLFLQEISLFCRIQKETHSLLHLARLIRVFFNCIYKIVLQIKLCTFNEYPCILEL